MHTTFIHTDLHITYNLLYNLKNDNKVQQIISWCKAWYNHSPPTYTYTYYYIMHVDKCYRDLAGQYYAIK